MTNYLDANPDLRIEIDHHRKQSRMVPLAKNGEFFMLTHRDYVANDPLPDPLPVADYVVGLELLGYRFFVADDEQGQGLYTMDPEYSIPSSWSQRALALAGALGGKRTGEIIDFLLECDGSPTLERHRTAPAA